MPILLPEDNSFPLPELYPVKQSFPREKMDDIPGAIRRQLARPEIAGRVRPGARVAVAVGSRGIRNLPLIVSCLIRELQDLGAAPFILAAMGSHGGGTEEGQRQVLYNYGVTEEAMGVPVISAIEVEEIGTSSRGVKVYFDRVALAADLVVPVNRIKLHTDFNSDIQSGLCKMLVIGLGNHQGCTSIHGEDFDHFGQLLKEAATMIMERAAVGFGLAVVENAYDETCLIEAVPTPAAELIRRETELVRVARDNMPRLMIPEIDVLIVEEIGKNISGNGYDPQILGRSFLLKEFLLEVPRIKRMVLCRLSEASHGNGCGLGAFDVITRRAFEQLDRESTYANNVAVNCLEDCKIPLIAADEAEAVRIAVKTTRGLDRGNLKIVKITNTLQLETIWVSPALLPLAEQHPALTRL